MAATRAAILCDCHGGVRVGKELSMRPSLAPLLPDERLARRALGSVAYGLRHGLNCLGCCWPLMALLSVGGVMNILLDRGAHRSRGDRESRAERDAIARALGAVTVGAGAV
jgi:hypothetical protein